ncbi:serine hydrolase [Rhodovulum sp.]|uniref:serine hydrolase n=1 Tax=Rhodovulum sp. TaxID=34009 RepID=UPI00257D8750|nr:serine hydrolase domain-containing protein [Rhodovulum sp.]
MLDGVTQREMAARAPGVVAMLTDRQGNVYEGARGMRDLATGTAMTTDMVFAIFSTTKAIGGTAVLQCVEEGLPDNSEIDMPGHGLYGTVGEYMKFIRMWLNDGMGPQGRVLKPETVAMAVQNGLQPHQKVVMLPGVIPSLSNDAEFFPGLRKGRSLTFMVNQEEAPTGRPAGAIGWAGLVNLFYWIDRQNGFGGFRATQTCLSAIWSPLAAISISRPRSTATCAIPASRDAPGRRRSPAQGPRP